METLFGIKGIKIDDTYYEWINFPYQGNEVEIRFRGKAGGPITPLSFENAIGSIRSYWMEQNPGSPLPTPSASTIEIYGDLRRIRSGNATTIERKLNIYTFQSPSNEIKFSVSKEEIVHPLTPFPAVSSLNRERSRISYSFQGGNLYVDFTVVNSLRYEIELEVKGPVPDWLIVNCYNKIVAALDNGNQSYPPDSLLREIQLKRNRNPFTTTELRELSRSELSRRRFFGSTSYYVAPKIDGVRAFMVIHHQYGIWLMTMTESIPITSAAVVKQHCVSIKGVAVDATFEGELEGTNFYPHDLIATSSDIRGLNYESRLKNLRKALFFFDVVNKRTPIFGNIKLVEKEIVALTVDDFFPTMERLLRPRDYPTDGLVFTPDTAYYPTIPDGRLVQMFPVADRIAGGYPDILKWKPLITIDFLCVNGGLYSLDKEGRDVPFVGTNDYPYRELVDSRLTGVNEFSWDGKAFKFVKARPDKKKGNKIDIATSNWVNIMEPITRDTLLGRDLFFLRKHHNYIKRELLKPLKGLLLDIGSGRGGDLTKYSSDLTVAAIEPNEDNMNEFLRRKQLLDKNNIFELLAKGEDHEAISGFLGSQKADTITLMLSASFFWETKSKLIDLATTIKKTIAVGGKLIVFTINGDVLRERAYPTFFPTAKPGIVEELSVRYEVDPFVPGEKGQKVLAVFPGETIVGSAQVEYCVYINELAKLLPDFDMSVSDSYRNKAFLSDAQKKYDQLYTVFVFHHQGKSTQPLYSAQPTLFYPSTTFPSQSFSARPLYTAELTPHPPTQLFPQPTFPYHPTPTQATFPYHPTPTQGTFPQPTFPYHPTTSPYPYPPTGYLSSNGSSDPGACPVPIPEKEMEIKFLYETTEPIFLIPSYDTYYHHLTPLGNPVTRDGFSTNNIYRLSSIGDGSCLIHSILRCYMDYNFDHFGNIQQYDYKKKYVETIRYNIADAMGSSIQNGVPLWRTINGGIYPELALNDLVSESSSGTCGIPFTLQGIQRMFKSTDSLGEDAAVIIGDNVGTNVYILNSTGNRISAHILTGKRHQYNIVVLGVGQGHYETIYYLENTGMYNCVLGNDHPFIRFLDESFRNVSPVVTDPVKIRQGFVKILYDFFLVKETNRWEFNVKKIVDPDLLSYIIDVLPDLRRYCDERGTVLGTIPN